MVVRFTSRVKSCAVRSQKEETAVVDAAVSKRFARLIHVNIDPDART